MATERKAKASPKAAAATADTTAPKQQIGTPFPPGQSGNPTGRPKGSRNKLGEAFLSALHDDFNEHGVKTIATVRAERPHDYLKVIASILPRELKIETTTDLSDEQLDARIRQLAAVLEIGIGGAFGGTPEAAEPDPAGEIPALH